MKIGHKGNMPLQAPEKPVETSIYSSSIWSRVLEEELVVMDGFDDCIAGIVSRCGNPDIVCYDLDMIFDKLYSEGMSEEEAIEWYEYNMVGAYVGEETPCFLEKRK